MKNSAILFVGFALLAIGLVPPEKGPDGFAPPLDENTKTNDFSMAIFFAICILGISIIYAILKRGVIPFERARQRRE